jgi:NADH-quinone oxidoreductase subunit G
MARVLVDGRLYEMSEERNLLHACLLAGLNLPYFCWHPALGSVGACRQCAVKQFDNERDGKGRLVMACMTPVTDGMRISIDDPEAREFRKSIVEWLMVNHPHDCPVCDEGGECHLQDMTVMTGHNYRRYRFDKRTFRNQDLGPFINHEMNRCITCYRCVRFYDDYAGGHDLQAMAAHDHVYFGRVEDGPLDNEFSGNLVEVCPTGVFTDKTLKHHYTRKWDLQTAPSVCIHCGLGCNIIAGERYGGLRRILNRYNAEVNGYFLCDRGRFGYEFVNGERRLRQPLMGTGESTAPTSRQSALKAAAHWLGDDSRVIGIGSPRASLEANFALRALVGPDRFYLGLSAAEQRMTGLMLEILEHGPVRTPSLREVEQSDAVLVLGEDVTNVAPRLALALRQSVRQAPFVLSDKIGIPRWKDAAVREVLHNERGPLIIAAPDATRLDEVASDTCRAAPADLARFAFAVAHAIDDAAPGVSDLPDSLHGLVRRTAAALSEARRPLVVSGPSCADEDIIRAAANIAWALHGRGRAVSLCFTVPECNTVGLGMLGGGDLEQALDKAHNGEVDTVVVIENDLYRRAPRQAVDEFLAAVRHLVVIDHTLHDTVRKAHVVLPAGTFAESDGTLVSNEGRAQRSYRAFPPDEEVQESWRWLIELRAALGTGAASLPQTLDELTAELSRTVPLFALLPAAAPPATFRIAGQRIPRQPPRYSGRTAMQARVNVSEPAQPADPDSALAFSMEGYQGTPPSALVPYIWSPGWNSVQATLRLQSEVVSPLYGGAAGVRLVEPENSGGIGYFRTVPSAFAPRPGRWLLVPTYHIFASEELSALAPAVASRAPAPHVTLNPGDAARLGVGVGDEVLVGGALLPVRLSPDLPRGLAGVPAGFAWSRGLVLPAWAEVKK